LPQEGDVILDCGAHIGNCAILFSRLAGQNGRVIALEPFQDSFEILSERIKRLKLDNITAIKKGVWNKNATLSLHVFENTISCKIVDDTADVRLGGKSQIDCITIDDLMDELKLTRLDMIKMDIEGAEIEALQGTRTTIRRFSPRFAIASYHIRNKKKTCHTVEQWLERKGYSVKTFFPSHLTTCANKCGKV
jgi:FkbM family methyltransferase